MKLAGHQSRRRDPAARSNVLDGAILLAEVAFVDSDEMIHVGRARRNQRDDNIFGAHPSVTKLKRDQQAKLEKYFHSKTLSTFNAGNKLHARYCVEKLAVKV